MDKSAAKPTLIPIDRAMEKFGIPLENRDFIRKFVVAIGVSGCEIVRSKSYIKALRIDGGEDLRIASGWSNGFVDEAEALAATGGSQPVQPDAKRRGTWYVDHPLNWLRG